MFDTNIEREAEILKPIASVEVVEKEEAKFDTEISEDDVPGEWKLKGQVLTRSPVRSGYIFIQPYTVCFVPQDPHIFLLYCNNIQKTIQMTKSKILGIYYKI